MFLLTDIPFVQGHTKTLLSNGNDFISSQREMILRNIALAPERCWIFLDDVNLRSF